MKNGRKIITSLLLVLFICASVSGVFPVSVYSAPAGNNSHGTTQNSQETDVDELRKELADLKRELADLKDQVDDIENKKIPEIEKKLALLQGDAENTPSVTEKVTEKPVQTTSPEAAPPVAAEKNVSFVLPAILIIFGLIVVGAGAVIVILYFGKKQGSTGNSDRRDTYNGGSGVNGMSPQPRRQQGSPAPPRQGEYVGQTPSQPPVSAPYGHHHAQPQQPEAATPPTQPHANAYSPAPQVNHDAENEHKAIKTTMLSYEGSVTLGAYASWDWMECDDDIVANLTGKAAMGASVYSEYVVKPTTSAKSFYQYALFSGKYLCPSFYILDESTGALGSGDAMMQKFIKTAKTSHMDFIFTFTDRYGNKLRLTDDLARRRVIDVKPAVVAEIRSAPGTYRVERCGTVVFDV